MARQRVLPNRHHHSLVTIAFAHKLAITVGRHPAGTSEMGVMDVSGALGVAIWIETEQNIDGFTPVGAVRRCVEQAQIELHVLAIIGREHCAIWRLV